MTSHFDMIEWIEKNTTLHSQVEIVYVVTGYCVSLLSDRGLPTQEFKEGDTVFQALDYAVRGIHK